MNSHHFLRVILFVLALSSVAALKANEVHVCQSGGADFTTIQAAVDSVQPGDVIKVAAAAYTEAKIVSATQYNLYITKTVIIRGGYTCADFTNQNPSANVTIIRPFTSSQSVISIVGINGQTSQVAPTINGFTITGGGGGNHGGGISMHDSDATISNNIITGNMGYLLGGGIWVQRGAPIIQNNRIESNQIPAGSGGNGGGVELESTQATLSGNVIANNAINDKYGNGGGVAIDGGGPVTLTNNTIDGNSAATVAVPAPTPSPPPTAYGGGVYVSGAPVNMTGNTVTNNKANGVVASGFGGGYGYGGGIYITNSPSFTLSGNTVSNNTAGYKYYVYLSGGGLRIDSSSGTLSGNVIQGNFANGNILFGNGGGLAVYTSTVTIQGGQISNNNVSINHEGYGGGLYAESSTVTIDSTRFDNNAGGNTPFYGLGGGLDFLDSPYTITNSIVSNNIAFSNDTAVGGLSARGTSPGLLINNTFVNNYAQGIRITATANVPNTLTATNNVIQGGSHNGTTGISAAGGATVTATYNDFYNYPIPVAGFSLDPSNIIINPNLDSTFHLNAGSPAIDAGTHAGAPDHDIDGEPRPMIGTSGFYKIDIGADEFTGTASQVQRNLATQPADFTLIGPGNPVENMNSTGPSDWIGFSVAAADVNGDGRSDLIAGAYNHSDDFDNQITDSGRVYALYGNGTRRLGTVDLYDTAPSLQVRSYINQLHISSSLTTADLNGDGTRDLIIGALGAPTLKGSVFVFQGGAGLAGIKTLSPTNQATWQFRSGEATTTFAQPNALAAGNLNNDAIDDLVVAEGNATGPGNRTNAGAVFVFFGSASLPALWDLATMPASLTIYGPANGSFLSRVAVGDVNGDGKLDLIARSSTKAYVFYGPLSSGTIDLASTPANATITGLTGDFLAAGDVDGDGKADIIIGLTNETDVVRGGTLVATQTIGAAAAARFTGVTPRTLYAFDWNGDGKAEMVVGDPFNNRAFVVFGGTLSGTADVSDRARWIIVGEIAGDQFGFSAGSGDLDADGTADLIIGSRMHNVTNHPLHFDDAGAVYVFYGTPPAPTPGLGNISTRAFVQTGDNVMIGGVIITGSGQKKVILRAIGPSLVNYGITNPLADPTLELHDSTRAVIASNDNWMDAPNRQEIIDSGLAPTNNLESAILTSLSPGNYTAIVRGVNNGTGIALVEGYDLDPTAGSKLGNISTRALAQTGDNVMIGGFIISGTGQKRVIVRAIGPSLAQYGITNPLADPFLELHDANGALITSNDNWRSTQEAEIIATGLPPSDDAESAIVQTLAPGNYTAIVRDVNNTIGVALVEVFGLN